MIRSLSAIACVSTFILGTAGAALAGGLDENRREAEAQPTFLISARDGYGVAECLTRGDECSFQVANAWCAAQGYHHASDLRVMAGGDSRTRTDAIAVTCNP